MSVDVEDHGSTRLLRLNRAEKKNAFNIELADATLARLAEAERDESVRVVIMTGEGDAFSAGADVGLFLAMAQGPVEGSERVLQVPRAIRALSKPTIAAVQGMAVGMGVTMLPHFDLVYASTRAAFLLPFAKLGLVQEFAASYTLPDLIGRQRAAEMLLRGAPIDAATAEDWGLVARVFEPDKLLDEVLAIASEIAAAPAVAVRHIKALLRDAELGDPLAVMDAEDKVLAARYGSPENVAAVQAFLAARSSDTEPPE